MKLNSRVCRGKVWHFKIKQKKTLIRTVYYVTEYVIWTPVILSASTVNFRMQCPRTKETLTAARPVRQISAFKKPVSSLPFACYSRQWPPHKPVHPNIHHYTLVFPQINFNNLLPSVPKWPKRILFSSFHIHSAVGIVTRYGLDVLGIESRKGRNFPHPSSPLILLSKDTSFLSRG